MKYLLNNHYCSHIGCNYTTGVINENESEADEKLLLDGGYDQDKKSCCPKCKNDSLVFLYK